MIKEHPERDQVQLEEVTTRQRRMEKSGLWPLLHWQRQGLSPQVT